MVFTVRITNTTLHIRVMKSHWIEVVHTQNPRKFKVLVEIVEHAIIGLTELLTELLLLKEAPMTST